MNWSCKHDWISPSFFFWCTGETFGGRHHLSLKHFVAFKKVRHGKPTFSKDSASNLFLPFCQHRASNFCNGFFYHLLAFIMFYFALWPPLLFTANKSFLPFLNTTASTVFAFTSTIIEASDNKFSFLAGMIFPNHKAVRQLYICSHITRNSILCLRRTKVVSIKLTNSTWALLSAKLCRN